MKADSFKARLVSEARLLKRRLSMIVIRNGKKPEIFALNYSLFMIFILIESFSEVIVLLMAVPRDSLAQDVVKTKYENR